jgi:hypothetical protein
VAQSAALSEVLCHFRRTPTRLNLDHKSLCIRDLRFSFSVFFGPNLSVAGTGVLCRCPPRAVFRSSRYPMPRRLDVLEQGEKNRCRRYQKYDHLRTRRPVRWERLRRLQKTSAIFEGCTKIAKIAAFLPVQSSCRRCDGCWCDPSDRCHRADIVRDDAGLKGGADWHRLQSGLT